MSSSEPPTQLTSARGCSPARARRWPWPPGAARRAGRGRAHHAQAGHHRARGHALGRAGGGLQGQGRGASRRAGCSIKPFLGGALGDENQTVGECRRGAIAMWGGTTGALATSVPEISVLELPYLFKRRRGGRPRAGRRRCARTCASGWRPGASCWCSGRRTASARSAPSGAPVKQPSRSQGPQDALAGEPGAPRDLPGAGGAAPAHRRHRGAAGAADRGGGRLRQHAASTPSPPPGTWPSSTSPCPSTSTSRARC